MSANKYLIVGIVSSLLLTGCWGSQPAEITPTPTPGITQEQLESLKTDLQTKTGSQLVTPKPETAANTKEINLTPQGEISGTGIAVMSKQGTQTSYQILADLPELNPQEKYWAWLTDGTTYRKLGQIRASKAGFVFEFTTKDDLSALRQVSISRETTTVDKPTLVVLLGEFK